MIIVIQCAASKASAAGHLLSSSGKPVMFVADPRRAPADAAHEYARPDDPSGTGRSWREVLLKYNTEPNSNPAGLYPAYQLYKNDIYRRLPSQFGLEKVYILSAGWGLVGANFLLPYYDITFSSKAKPYKRRSRADHYNDFRMLPEETDDEVLFLGGDAYLELFSTLTSPIRRRTIFYNSKYVPDVTGCMVERFETAAGTNWHYQCAKALLEGTLNLPSGHL